MRHWYAHKQSLCEVFMATKHDDVWAGTEASLYANVKAEEARAARMQAGVNWESSHKNSGPRLLDLQGNLAVISVKGSLNNDDDSDWNEYVGATGYPEIREAILEAASNPEVNHILLDVDSGGGSATGVEDVSNLVRLVNDKVKPVTAYTSDSMYSAAYWLASGAGEIYASKSAGVGSIGVLAIHSDKSKMMADMGIKQTLIRAGQYKALANGVEPLSEAGRAQIQARVDGFYKIFVEQVSSMRGKSYDYTDKVMAQGKEFTGTEAHDVGLVDGVMTFEELATKLKASIDASTNFMDNRSKQGSTLRVETNGDANMGRKTLSEQDIAALASGVSLEASVSPEETAEAPTKTEVAPVAEQEMVIDAAAVEQTILADVDSSAATIRFMKEQVKETQEALTASQIKVAKLEDKLAELEAVVSPLKDIAAKATNNMRIACRAAHMDMTAMTSAQVLAEYNAITPTFLNQFKTGGVAAVDAGSEEKKPAAWAPNSLLQAKIAAVRGK
jgi:capsid assembly protease